MFDTVCVRGGSSTTTQSQSLNINAVSGTIIKSHPKSFFKKFNINSNYAKRVFSENPCIVEYRWRRRYDESWEEVEKGEKEVVILQTMLCGDGVVLAELMWKDDFDELFRCEEVEDN
jgi:hypothetical protein